MGMFDELWCAAPLPDWPDWAPPASDEVFQTKDTPHQQIHPYRITADGQLQAFAGVDDPFDEVRHLGPWSDASSKHWHDVDDDDVIRFYTSIGERQPGDLGKYWMEYKAVFIDGKLAKPISRVIQDEDDIRDAALAAAKEAGDD